MKLTELTDDLDDPNEPLYMLEMANLYPQKTGLPYVVFFGEVGGQHGPRIKVSNTRGKFNRQSNFVVSVDENPEVKAGKVDIPSADLKAVIAWVKENLETLKELWVIHESGDGDAEAVIAKLKKVS